MEGISKSGSSSSGSGSSSPSSARPVVVGASGTSSAEMSLRESEGRAARAKQPERYSACAMSLACCSEASCCSSSSPVGPASLGGAWSVPWCCFGADFFSADSGAALVYPLDVAGVPAVVCCELALVMFANALQNAEGNG